MIWISIIVADLTRRYAGIWSEYNLLENITMMILIFSWIIPFLALCLINRKRIKLILFFSMLLVVLYFNPLRLMFAGCLVFHSFWINEGYIKVYEQTIEPNKSFVLYMSPHRGITGGRVRTYAIVNDLFWGFNKREWLDTEDIVMKKGTRTGIDTIYCNSNMFLIDRYKIAESY